MSKDSWSREKSALFALDDQRVSSRREIFVQIRFVRTPFHDPCVFCNIEPFTNACTKGPLLNFSFDEFTIAQILHFQSWNAVDTHHLVSE